MPSAPIGRLAVPAGLDDELAVTDPERGAAANAGAFTRNRLWPAIGNRPSDAQTYQDDSPPESSLPGSPPGPGAQLPGQGRVDDLRGAVGAPRVVVGPRGLHVGLVVETLEALQRVARAPSPRGRDGGRAARRARAPKPKKRSSMPTKASSPPARLDPRGHVVQQPERVVPLAALVELRVAQQAGAGLEGVDPAAAERRQLVGEAACRPAPARPAPCSGGRRRGRACA